MPSPNEDKDCSKGNVTISDDICTSKGLKSAFRRKPKCWRRLKYSCKEFRDGHDMKIPDDCTSWFDGCNTCKVENGAKKGCTKKYCLKKSKPFCLQFADGTECVKSKAEKMPDCRKPGASDDKTCVDVITDLDVSDQSVCRKALFLCENLPDVVANCKTSIDEAEREACNTATDKKKQAKCCVQGKLVGDVCKPFGRRDKLPDDCETKCFDNGEFKRDVKDCVRCRGKGTLRAPGGKTDSNKPEDKPDKRPFDPARVRETVKQLADRLSESGKKCVRSIAEATSKLRTQIRRWRDNNPDQKEDSKQETDAKELADVQAEIDETAESSKDLEDEFEDDDEGKAQRAKNLWERLEKKINDVDKPKQCGAEFDELKTAFNDIVEKYADLPSTLKAQGVERVSLEFADTDIGKTDLQDSKSVCKFAGRLVSRLKKAETNHRTRLKEARKLLCTKAGELLKKKRVSNLYNCLRKARRDAQAGSDAAAKQQADDDAKKFDDNTLLRIKKLMGMMKKKCLVKKTPQSTPRRVAGVFKKTLRSKIKKKAGSLTDQDKKDIADKFNGAVIKNHPDATNIVTTIADSTRRQLRPRRALGTTADVETTWDLDTPSRAGDSIVVDLGTDFDAEVPTLSAQPTDGSIQGTQAIEPIDDDLPDGRDGAEPPSTTSQAPSSTEEEEQASTGAREVASGAAAAICATLLFF